MTQYVYDAAGQLLEVTEKLTDSTSRTSSYVYDDLGRLTRSVQPDPSSGAGIYTGTVPGTPDSDTPFMDYTYDAAGNLLSAKDSAALGTTYAYDALHRRISETDANGDTTRFTYDRVGNLLSLTDPEESTTSWQYDPLDRVTRETNELGHARQFTYDAAGRLTEWVDRNGRVIEYAYDDLDRLTTESWFADVSDVTADREIEFGYDLLGRLTDSNDPDHQYSYQYNRRDLDVATTREIGNISGLEHGFWYENVYDAVGNLTSTSMELGGGYLDFSNDYAYDNLYRLTSVEQSGLSAGAVAPKRVDFTYDLAGQFDTLTRYASTITASPVAVTDYTFDYAGRLTEIEHRSGSNPAGGNLLAGYGYTWNQRSQLTAIDFLPDGTNSDFDYSDEDVIYDYDNRHQLESATYDGQSNETYEYDDNGNRTSGGFTVGDNNQLLSDGTYDYEYDNEGNIVLRTKISDGSYTQYSWDHRNRLVKVTDFDDEEAEVSRVEYRYDADNQLIGRKVFLNGSITASESGVFVYQFGQVVLQFDGTGNGNLEYEENLSHRYLWGPAVDMLLADEQVDWTDSDADGEVLWALTDHLGTVRDVIDNNADVVDHAEYNAFGNRLNAAAVDVLFGYTGKLFDQTTGLQNNWNRWYDPAVGRWMSEDFVWDGTNPYAYVGNQTTTFVDPSGLAGHHWIPRAIADALRKRLTDGAYGVFTGGLTGLLPYNHGADTWNGVTHPEYSSAVRELLDAYIGKSKLDAARAKAFRDAIARGECPPGLDSKKFADALDAVRKWRDGFIKSVVVAQAAKDAAKKKGIKLSPEELKAIGRQAVNGETTEHLTKRAREIYNSLGPIKKSALTAAAKRILPLLGFAIIANDARRGFAQDGAIGAGDEVIRGIVCADLVESIAFPAIRSGVDAVGDHLNINEEGHRKRLRTRFGDLVDELGLESK